MKYIYKKQKLDENETRKFMRQIVSAVDHLHKAGIIHRQVDTQGMSRQPVVLYLALVTHTTIPDSDTRITFGTVEIWSRNRQFEFTTKVTSHRPTVNVYMFG